MKFDRLLLFLALMIPVAVYSQGEAAWGRKVIHEVIDGAPVRSADTLYTMDFETVENFSLTFGTWGVRDMDSSQTFSINGYAFPHQGDPMAYICFNPGQVVPAMTDAAIQAHSGNKFGASFSAVTPPNKDWFISPRIKLAKGGDFSFWVKSYTNAYGYEKYKVAVSAATNNPADFAVISGNDPLIADTSWTQKSFSLSAFNDQEVYVAIQCVSDTAFIFMIDDLVVNPGDTAESYPSSLSQDFEQVPDFSLDFNPWKVRDVNGGNTYGIENCYFPNNGSPMAWINFNPSAATPPPLNMNAHTGNKFGACFSSVPPNNPNNKWLISPKMKPESNARITFWVQSYNLQYGYEKFRVGVSATGTDPSDFEIISGAIPDSAPGQWTKKVYSLDQFAGTELYVGIQCVTNNGFCLMLDDITINSSFNGVESRERVPLSVFPVPADEWVSVSGVVKGDVEGEILISDLTGTPVRRTGFIREGDSLNINVKDLPDGVFIVSLPGREVMQTGKIIVKH